MSDNQAKFATFKRRDGQIEEANINAKYESYYTLKDI